jgi:proteasome assembly chaperone (PAC2) family protein
MQYTRIEELPSLRSPVMLVAFAGWNDAAEAATAAARLLIEKWSARRFADIDAEELYDFTSTRPTVRVGADFQRQLEWPGNSFFYHSDPALERDAVILVGTEPQLKWRTFTSEIVEVARQCGVSMVTTLGAMLTDTPHSRPVPLIGFATNDDLVARLREFQIGPTRYEGPTGILGAIYDACQREGLPAVSLWASVPHYLGVTQNPKVAAALLRTVDTLLGLHLDLGDLERAVKRFEAQVEATIAKSPEAAAYVKELERRVDAAQEEEEGEGAGTAELPPSEALIEDLEEFLRRRREQGGNDRPS